MVSQGHDANFTFLRHACKKIMPQFSRGHFDGQFCFFRKFLHVCPSGGEGQSHRSGGLTNQFFVGVAAASAQPVIEMSNGQFPLMAG